MSTPERACGELMIELSRIQGGAYEVVIRLTDPDNHADQAPLRGMTAIDPKELLPLQNQPDIYGRRLSAQLFADASARQFYLASRTALEQRERPVRVQVAVDPSAPELHDLRWELLRDPVADTPLATSERLLLSRYMRSHDWRKIRPRPRTPMRAVVAVSAPPNIGEYGLAVVDLQGELFRAKAALTGIDVSILGEERPLTVDELIDTLARGADIVYLVCHGGLRRGTQSTPLLYLQQEDGRTRVIEALEMARRIGELEPPRLMVLASCESAGRGSATASSDDRPLAQASLARLLAEAGVPAILAMQANIGMETVRKVMPTFFTEVLVDGRIDRALAVARRGVRERPDFWVPALYLRLKDGRLWADAGGGSDTQHVATDAPQWDEDTYLRASAPTTWQTLRASVANLPANVILETAANPWGDGETLVGISQEERVGRSEVNAVDLCLQSRPGETIVLVGPGGAGKSTLLRMVRHQASMRRRDDRAAPLPILLALGGYRGSLRSSIEDELGVSIGDWESIQGSVLLLCDGLNELGTQDQAKLVSELSKLLRRRRVAVVLTLRTAGLPAPIVLPANVQSFALRPLTFADIRQLAARSLDPESALAFLTEIRKRLTFAGASLFTLPFGVMMLMRSFRDTGRLPGSVGELVGNLLRRRFAANEEILARQPSLTRLPESIVDALARRTAEEMRLQRRHTVVNRGELEDIVRRVVRAIRAGDAFEAESLRDAMALEALRVYEILSRDAAGSFHFEHEIIAAYLVSERLAAAWSSHQALLVERSLDEAWMLAARHVDDDACDEFFAKLCDTDLILAVSAVVERGQPVPTVESRLIMTVRAGTSSLVSRWQVFSALAILATPDIIAELRGIVTSKPPESDEHERALRALCTVGDRETLAAVLNEADVMASLPGVRASGGAIAVWEWAPPQAALAMARERVNSYSGGPVVKSLRTIGEYGDISDVPILLQVIHKTNEYHIAAHAYQAAAQFDETRARQTLLAESKASAPGMHVLALKMVGPAPEDASWLLDFMLSEEAQTRDGAQYADMAAEMLAGMELPGGLKQEIRTAYAQASENSRLNLWRIAQTHKFTSFEELAVDALRAPESYEAGHAANFAIGHVWQDDAHRAKFLALARTATESDRFVSDWPGQRLSTFLLTIGDAEIVGRAVERLLRRLVAEFVQASEDSPDLILIRTELEEALLIAGEVAERIPIELILDVLRIGRNAFMTYDRSTMSLLRLLARVDPSAIDAVLCEIEDEDDRVRAACLVAPLGTSATRVELVGDGFERNLDTPLILNPLVKASELLWSDTLLRRIVRSLIRGWGLRSSNVREDALARLGSLVSKQQAETILAPILPKLPMEEHHVRQTLELWHDIGKRRKR